MILFCINVKLSDNFILNDYMYNKISSKCEVIFKLRNGKRIGLKEFITNCIVTKFFF